MNEVSHGFDFATGGYLFEDTHTHHDFATHCPGYLVIVSVFVLAQIFEEIILCVLILLAVGYLAGDVLAHLVRQLCQYLCFLPSEETAAP